MKIKFKNSTHRTTFSAFVSEKIKSPFCSRNEFIAAAFLLSADEFLWKRSRKAMTEYSVNFNSINLTGISTEGYALFMAAKAVYCGGADISLNELTLRNCSPQEINLAGRDLNTLRSVV